jgi:hypothetical protein
MLANTSVPEMVMVIGCVIPFTYTEPTTVSELEFLMVLLRLNSKEALVYGSMYVISLSASKAVVLSVRLIVLLELPVNSMGKGS